MHTQIAKLEYLITWTISYHLDNDYLNHCLFIGIFSDSFTCGISHDNICDTLQYLKRDSGIIKVFLVIDAKFGAKLAILLNMKKLHILKGFF